MGRQAVKYIFAFFVGLVCFTYAQTSAGATKVSSKELDLPASFSGTLPCADCEGISYHLNLLPNNIFYLSSEYLGKKDGQTRFDDIGKYSSKNKIIILKGGREAPIFFQMTSHNVLKKLDMHGQVINSKLNYILKRDAVFQAVHPRLFMSGMYSYMADAGIFKNCITGQTYSVTTQYDNIELERAYLDTQHIANVPVMALVEGEIIQRPNMEGNLSTLIVHKFLRLESNQRCLP